MIKPKVAHSGVWRVTSAVVARSPKGSIDTLKAMHANEPSNFAIAAVAMKLTPHRVPWVHNACMEP